MSFCTAVNCIDGRVQEPVSYYLRNHFKVKFTISEITNVKNVSDIKKYLTSHGVDLND